MKELKLLLACGVLFGMTAGIAACDVDDSEDCEVGDCTEADGGAGGEGGEGGGMMDPEYRYVVIVDDSMVENMNGTPGADICGIVADCGGTELTGVSAELIAGDGLVCDGSTTEAPCESGTDRGNEAAALDTGANCEAGSSPSDYVSLGVVGQIAVQFDQDLQGCNLNIIELVGPDMEPYDVYVCQSTVAEAETCLLMGSVGSSGEDGGSVSIDVPAAE